MNRLADVPAEDIGISCIVTFELSYGAYNSRQTEMNLMAMDQLISAYASVPFENIDAHQAGRIRAFLKKQGTPIGAQDTLIAGQALARDLTVVTSNPREFARVPGLEVEDWVQEDI